MMRGAWPVLISAEGRESDEGYPLCGDGRQTEQHLLKTISALIHFLFSRSFD